MELEFIQWLRDQLPTHRQVLVGPGDDAAILKLLASDQFVVTSDLLTDGVDFLLDQVDARRVGRKSLAVNLSDLAAMAAKPVAAIISVVLPTAGGLQLAKQLYEGLLPLADQFDVAIAGGDTNSWDGKLVISITTIGEVTERGCLLRSSAKIGDDILVTGSFGGSIFDKQFDFVPRTREAIQLNENYDLHAAIDVSDGLSLDVSRIAQASGVGASLDLSAIPLADDALRRSKESGRAPIDHALADGEDFELVFTSPHAEAERILRDQPLDCPITRIGEIIDRQGLWTKVADGTLEPLTPRGYEHQLES